MANQKQLDILKQDVGIWNQWRKEHPDILPDLREANLSGADLYEAILRGVNLSFTNLTRANLSKADLHYANLSKADLGTAILRGADLSGADLRGATLIEAILKEADLSGANLSKADLYKATLSGVNLRDARLEEANLRRADLSEANLRGANFREANLMYTDLAGVNLSGANLSGADLGRANLSRANLSGAFLVEADLSSANLRGTDLSFATLSRATLVGTNLAEATLTSCKIYGIAAWDVELKGAIQDNLVITPRDQPTITIDNLKVAQFIYLLLNNAEIRDVVDTIAKKAVLILGRFTPERKAVLDALREALRTHGYLPILFDFDKPSSQDFTETVSTLAHLSRFVIADLTDPSSIPQELYAFVPHRMVPVQPLLKESEDSRHLNSEYSMFIDLRKKYHWVLSTHRYRELEDLLASLEARVIEPAEQKAQELEKR